MRLSLSIVVKKPWWRRYFMCLELLVSGTTCLEGEMRIDSLFEEGWITNNDANVGWSQQF